MSARREFVRASRRGKAEGASHLSAARPFREFGQCWARVNPAASAASGVANQTSGIVRS